MYLRRFELQVRRDGSVLAVVDVQGHLDAVARDVFDLDIRHHDVDRPVSNEVPEYEVHDPFLRDRVEFDAELAEDAIDHAPKVVLLLGPLRAFEKLQVADEDLLEDVEEFRFLFDELRLDRLVEVLVRHRVVQDPDVRVVLQDRLDFNLVHVLLDDLRDRRDLPEGRLHDAADLRGLHLDAPVAEQAAEVPLLDRVEGAEDGCLAVLLEVVEHLLRFTALPVEVRNAACGGGLPSAQLLDCLGINLLRGLAHSHTSDDQEREHADDEQDEAVTEPVRDLPRIEDAGKDTVPEAVHDNRDEERDLDVVDDRRQVVGEGARAGERATRSGFQGAARFQHLREEGHVQDPDRHQEHHERDVDDRDVRRHRDPPLVLRELVLLRVVTDHRQDVGDIATCVGGLHDDRDDPLDHGGLHARREEVERLGRGDSPGAFGGHLLALRGDLAVAAAARHDDRIGEGHAEPARFRDVTQEVGQASFDLFDLALLLRQEESVRADEPEDRDDEPEEEPLDRPLVPPEAELDRVDQVQERDESREHHQGGAGRHDGGLSVGLLVEADAGLR